MFKKITTIASLIFISNVGFTQTVDQLKKDNQKLKAENEALKLSVNDLKAKVDLCNAIEKNKDVQVKSFTDFYDIKVLKCKGNKGEQTVTIELLVTQNKVNQRFSFDYSNIYAYDQLGTKYSCLKIINSNNESYNCEILTDIPMKFTIKIANVLPGLESFKIVTSKVSTYNLSTYDKVADGVIEIRNLKIEW